MCVALSLDQSARHARNDRFMVSVFRRREQFIGIMSPVHKELVCGKSSIKLHAGPMPFTLPAVR